MRVLDLCGGTGSWSKPYADAGYEVIVVDLPNDVRLLKYPGKVHGILAAPPCTRFSYARNRYPAGEAEVRDALSIFDACIRLAHICSPAWWALENPINLVRRYLGPPGCGSSTSGSTETRDTSRPGCGVGSRRP